jgi:hypothetical protein
MAIAISGNVIGFGECFWDLAAAKGLLFGPAASWQTLLSDPIYAGSVARGCSVLVAENDMRWPRIEPARATISGQSWALQ